MFDIGFWEMLVIGVMALVILGPERLPGAIKSTMSTVRSIKQMATGFKDEVASQIDAHELHQNLKKAEQLGMQNIGKDLQESVDELKAAAKSVQRPYEMPDKPIANKSEQDSTDNASPNNAEQVALDSPQASDTVELSLDINNHQNEKEPVAQQTEQISLLLDDDPKDAQPAKSSNNNAAKTSDNNQTSGKA